MRRAAREAVRTGGDGWHRVGAGLRTAARWGVMGAATLLAAGCHHRRRQAYGPPPPPLQGNAARQHGPIAEPKGRPTLVEVGMASWYGPSGRRSADGEKYNGNSMTAAHKTLPMGTVARVTNLSNGESVMVRITDRGPFSHGRILDLSESAAKKIDLYRMGVAKVRVEAYGAAVAAAAPGGRWCVQTGAFRSQRDAVDLKTALVKRYVGARVTEFPGATGYWVRIDPARHYHADASAIQHWIGDPGAQATSYLVRID